MIAISKVEAREGVQLLEVEEPEIRPGCVKIRIEKGSVCGTDLHIFEWDGWAKKRMQLPRIIGHEFCGTVVEVSSDVNDRSVGDFVASESHLVCGTCPQCLSGDGHVCVNTVILGVDVDGGFASHAVIPAQNARPIPSSVPKSVASLLDALGNAVHTVMSGPIENCNVLITGMGPIGLFSVAICRALGANTIVGTEISDYRSNLALQLGADKVLNPKEVDVLIEMRSMFPRGVDVSVEMSGRSSSLDLVIEATRPGGRVSLLGVFPEDRQLLDVNNVIFKGLEVQGIVGRRLWETWDQMNWLLTEKGLDILPVVTHEMPFTEVEQAMKIMKEGRAGKIVLDFA